VQEKRAPWSCFIECLVTTRSSCPFSMSCGEQLCDTLTGFPCRGKHFASLKPFCHIGWPHRVGLLTPCRLSGHGSARAKHSQREPAASLFSFHTPVRCQPKTALNVPTVSPWGATGATLQTPTRSRPMLTHMLRLVRAPNRDHPRLARDTRVSKQVCCRHTDKKVTTAERVTASRWIAKLVHTSGGRRSLLEHPCVLGASRTSVDSCTSQERSCSCGLAAKHGAVASLVHEVNIAQSEQVCSARHSGLLGQVVTLHMLHRSERLFTRHCGASLTMFHFGKLLPGNGTCGFFLELVALLAADLLCNWIQCTSQATNEHA